MFFGPKGKKCLGRRPKPSVSPRSGLYLLVYVTKQRIATTKNTKKIIRFLTISNNDPKSRLLPLKINAHQIIGAMLKTDLLNVDILPLAEIQLTKIVRKSVEKKFA